MTFKAGTFTACVVAAAGLSGCNSNSDTYHSGRSQTDMSGATTYDGTYGGSATTNGSYAPSGASASSGSQSGWRDSNGQWHDVYNSNGTYNGSSSTATPSSQSGWRDSNGKWHDTSGTYSGTNAGNMYGATNDKWRESGNGQPINATDLPAKVDTGLRREAEGMPLNRTMKTTWNGKTVYEAETTSNGTTYKICVDEDGNLIAKRRADYMTNDRSK